MAAANPALRIAALEELQLSVNPIARRRHFRFHVRQLKRIIFITGTDTGVGKTVLTALLVRFLRERGVKAVALKPICSGDRADARALRAAMDGALSLDEINPWHFRAPVAPLLAARREQNTSSSPRCWRTFARCKNVSTCCWLKARAVC